MKCRRHGTPSCTAQWRPAARYTAGTRILETCIHLHEQNKIATPSLLHSSDRAKLHHMAFLVFILKCSFQYYFLSNRASGHWTKMHYLSLGKYKKQWTSYILFFQDLQSAQRHFIWQKMKKKYCTFVHKPSCTGGPPGTATLHAEHLLSPSGDLQRAVHLLSPSGNQQRAVWPTT